MARLLNFQHPNIRNASHTVDNHEDVIITNPTDTQVLLYDETNKIWKNGDGVAGKFETGYDNFTFHCDSWDSSDNTVVLSWARAGNMVTLYVPELIFITRPSNTPGNILSQTGIPVSVRPDQTVTQVINVRDVGVNQTGTFTMSTFGKITIYRGLYTPFNVLLGQASGSFSCYISYKTSATYGSTGGLGSTNILPVMSFTDLDDTPSTYQNSLSLLRVNNTVNGLEEVNVQLSIPNSNQVKFTSGTTDMTITADCDLDQNLSSLSTPTHADLNITSLNTSVATALQLGKTNGFDATNAALVTFTIVNGATPTFTVAGGPYVYWQNSVKYTRTTDTIPITDTQGMHYVYYNGATLTESLTFDITFIRDYCAVAMFYWEKGGVPANSLSLFIGRETHGFMPWQSHYLEHYTVGTQYISGLALDGFTIGSGALDVHAQLGCSSGGSILDEDIVHTISSVATPRTFPVWYRSGASAWKRNSVTGFPVMTTGTGRLAYNSFSTPNWGLTEISNQKYVLYHIFATNSYATTDGLISVMGEAEYTSSTAARTGANNELANLKTFGLPMSEWIPVATIIFQTDNGYANAVKAKIVVTDTGANYVNWAGLKIMTTATAPSSHHNLTDLPTYDDHTQYVKTATSAPTDNTLAIWDGITGRLLKGTSISVASGTNISGVGTLGITNTFTSSLTSAGSNAQVLNFNCHADPGSYSFIGPLFNYSFGQYSGSGPVVCSGESIVNCVGSGHYFKVNTGTAPLGTSTIFSVKSDGYLQLNGGQTINEFSTDISLGGNSDIALPTERAIKTYVDTKIGGGSNVLTHNTTWYGPWASPVTGNILYCTNGKLVTITMPSLQANATGSSIIIISTVLPVGTRPPSAVYFKLLVLDNYNTLDGTVMIGADGSINVLLGTTSPFTGTGLTGSNRTCCTYMIS